MRIAICGAHGVGKSTFAAWLGQELNLPVLNTPGRWMAARRLPINEDATVASQVLAWLLQQTFEDEQPEWVASRSLIDTWAYTSLAAARDLEPLSRELFAALTTVTRAQVQGRYDALFYVRPRIRLRPDAVRSGNEDFQSAMDCEVRAGLADFAVSYVELDVLDQGSRRDALKDLNRLRDSKR